MRVVNTIIICAALVLAGCESLPPRIETQDVKVKVIEKREAPAALKACPKLGPLPVFLPVEGEPDWAALDAAGQRRLRDLLVALDGCVATWRSWEAAP